jgi:hypothetical protein
LEEISSQKFKMAFFIFFVQFSTSCHSGVKHSNCYFWAYSWRIRKKLKSLMLNFYANKKFFSAWKHFFSIFSKPYSSRICPKITVWMIHSAVTTRGKLYKKNIKNAILNLGVILNFWEEISSKKARQLVNVKIAEKIYYFNIKM